MQVVREHRDDLVFRLKLLSRLVTGLLVLIAVGFWFVQLVQGDYYRELAENNRLRRLPIQAPRGLIYDRKGRLLVENIPSYNLMVDRSRSEDLPGALAFAAEVLGHGVRLTALGLASGFGLAVLFGRALAGLLYSVSPTDGATFATVLAVLAAVALIATWLPARRALGVDPLEAMRMTHGAT